MRSKRLIVSNRMCKTAKSDRVSDKQQNSLQNVSIRKYLLLGNVKQQAWEVRKTRTASYPYSPGHKNGTCGHPKGSCFLRRRTIPQAKEQYDKNKPVSQRYSDNQRNNIELKQMNSKCNRKWALATGDDLLRQLERRANDCFKTKTLKNTIVRCLSCSFENDNRNVGSL